MARMSHRPGRWKHIGRGEAGVSLADALVALVILALAFAVALRPMAASTTRVRAIATEMAETLAARQQTLDNGDQP
jgi:hypothetical protein